MTSIWSHRGRVDLDAAAPDNTVAAMKLTSDHRIEGVEIDTWLTADDDFVVVHDRDTAAGRVDEGRRAGFPHLPGLGEILDAASVKTLNVELKVPPGASTDLLADAGTKLADRLGLRAGRTVPTVVVSSFSRVAADAVVLRAPMLRASYLCLDPPGTGGLEELAGRGYWGVHASGERLDQAVVESIHAAGLVAVAWTVNDLGAARRLAGAGLDAVITDVPLSIRRGLAATDPTFPMLS